MARHDPLRNFRFRLEIAGLTIAGFSEVAIGTTTTDVVAYREGSDLGGVRKLPGLTHYGHVTLKRGLGTTLDLFQWSRQVATGDIAAARRQIAIVVLDETGADGARFLVHSAWPAKYEMSGLHGLGNEVAIEVLELANEGVERVA